MELDYEEFFKITLCAMRINQTDPAIKRNIKWLIYFLITHGFITCIFVVLIYNIIFINLKERNYPMVCKTGILVVVYLVITFQYSIMLWKQKHMKILMDEMKEDYVLAKSLPMEEQKIIHDFALQGKNVCKQWFAISSVGTCLFPMKSFVLIMFYWIVDGQIYLIPMYDLVYPTYIEERKDNLLIFLLINLAFLICGIYSSVMYCAFIPIGPVFTLHACGQLSVVKSRIDSLFDDDDVEEVKQKLKDIVKHLQIIYVFVARIQLCFRIAFEVTMKTTMIILPVTCFEVIESVKHGELSLEFMIFIIGGILLSSSPCYYSNLLMEKGENIRLAMYSCGWEKVPDRAVRSTIGIVLQRGLRPAGIRALFRTMSLETLSELFEQSYTIFNIMNCMFD